MLGVIPKVTMGHTAGIQFLRQGRVEGLFMIVGQFPAVNDSKYCFHCRFGFGFTVCSAFPPLQEFQGQLSLGKNINGEIE